MGAVWLAEDTRLAGRLCALKEIISDPSLPESAQQQARAKGKQPWGCFGSAALC